MPPAAQAAFTVAPPVQAVAPALQDAASTCVAWPCCQFFMEIIASNHLPGL